MRLVRPTTLVFLATALGAAASGHSEERASGLTFRLAPFRELVRFNRVEGATFGLGAEAVTTGRRFVALDASVGYALSAKRARYEVRGGVGLRHASGATILSARLFDRTDMLGVDPAGMGGNTPMAFFLRYDVLDYYGRHGWALELAEEWRRLRARVSAGRERQDTLSSASPAAPSPFGGAFRGNPVIDDGRLGFVDLDLELDLVSRPGIYPRGHRHAIRLRRAGGGLMGGQHEFTRLQVESDLYLRGFRSQLLALHLRAGAAAAALPRQESFWVGGPTTLRGEPVGSQHGNHFWNARVDHYLPPGPLARLRFPNPLFYSLRPIVFADAGAAWEAGTFGCTRGARTRASVGVGIGDTGHLFRINGAWPIGERRPRFSALLTYAW